MLQQQQETNTGSEGKAPGRKGRHLHGELRALQEGQPAVPRLTAPCTFPRSPTSQNTRGSQETLEMKPVSTKSETQLERDSSESPVQPLPQTVVPLTMAGDVKWDSAPQTTHSPRSSGTRPGQDSHSPWTVPGTPSPVGFACRPVWTACPFGKHILRVLFGWQVIYPAHEAFHQRPAFSLRTSQKPKSLPRGETGSRQGSG